LRSGLLKTIALDAMGGDHAPQVEVEGAVEAARAGGVRVLLVGDQKALTAELERRGVKQGDLPLEIRHASQVITMHDAPSQVVRRKTDSSMRVAVELCKSDQADAVVSAGNSGAMLACGLFALKRLPGVDRPAILTTFPTRRGTAALLDMGANVDCKPVHLTQFAVLGATFARVMHGKARPRVGLLCNGSEEHKGTELTRQTHQVLQSGVGRRDAPKAGAPGFDYLGYVEGRDIFSGDVDVVVCDGFTGNVVLKVTEGVAETLVAFLKEAIGASLVSKVLALGLVPAFRRMKARMDYAEQGGAPLLGVQGTAIICHGGSNARAIRNAILGAGRFVDSDLCGALARAIEDHRTLSEAARGRAAEAEAAVT
jgi:phosphate acyltransferase